MKIKGGCQSGRKVVTHDSKSDLSLSDKHLLIKTTRRVTLKKLLTMRTKNVPNQLSNLEIVSSNTVKVTMAEENDIDMTWDGNKDLSVAISFI